jgi:hypothetical protein
VIDQHRKLLDLFERGDGAIEQVIEGHIVRLRAPATTTVAISREQRRTSLSPSRIADR